MGWKGRGGCFVNGDQTTALDLCNLPLSVFEPLVALLVENDVLLFFFFSDGMPSPSDKLHSSLLVKQMLLHCKDINQPEWKFLSPSSVFAWVERVISWLSWAESGEVTGPIPVVIYFNFWWRQVHGTKASENWNRQQLCSSSAGCAEWLWQWQSMTMTAEMTPPVIHAPYLALIHSGLLENVTSTRAFLQRQIRYWKSISINVQ